MVSIDSSMIAVVITKPPHGSLIGKEALDMILMLCTYEIEVRVFFLLDGVFQILSHQKTSLLQKKNYIDTFKALKVYGVEHIYVCLSSVLERNIASDFIIDIELCSIDQITQILKKSTKVIVY